MKKIFSTLIFAQCMLLFMSCRENQSKPTSPVTENKGDNHQHNYACPMHPEITGNQGDKCSKCGMDLTLVDEKSISLEYFMAMKAEPAELTAQQNASLFFTPKVKGDESARVPLDVVHDKKMHLIVVSNDLSYFDHVHPEFQATGDYKINVTNAAGVKAAGMGNAFTQFPSGGDYMLFADYVPTGAGHKLEKIPLHVSGNSIPQKSWSKEVLMAKDGEFEMRLKTGSGQFYSLQTNHIDAPLMRNGKAIKTSELDDFLGAKAHMVVIGVNDMAYLHVHPEEHDGVLDLHADFEKPGFYRGWIQFKYKGELHTMSFVIEVKDGTGIQPTAHDHDHEHGEEHKH